MERYQVTISLFLIKFLLLPFFYIIKIGLQYVFIHIQLGSEPLTNILAPFINVWNGETFLHQFTGFLRNICFWRYSTIVTVDWEPKMSDSRSPSQNSNYLFIRPIIMSFLRAQQIISLCHLNGFSAFAQDSLIPFYSKDMD